jgi:hypothetical protein
MKKSILMLAILALSSIAFAQVDSSGLNKNIRYCAKLKDGLLVIISDNKQIITSDIITSNGTVIKANGNVIKKDGVTTILKEGECVDAKGFIVGNKNKAKTNKEDQDKAYLKQ